MIWVVNQAVGHHARRAWPCAVARVRVVSPGWAHLHGVEGQDPGWREARADERQQRLGWGLAELNLLRFAALLRQLLVDEPS